MTKHACFCFLQTWGHWNLLCHNINFQHFCGIAPLGNVSAAPRSIRAISQILEQNNGPPIFHIILFCKIRGNYGFQDCDLWIWNLPLRSLVKEFTPAPGFFSILQNILFRVRFATVCLHGVHASNDLVTFCIFMNVDYINKYSGRSSDAWCVILWFRGIK